MSLTSVTGKTRRYTRIHTAGGHVGLLVLGIAAASSASVDLALHKRLGYGMTALVVVHVALHQSWLARQLSKRPFTPHWKPGLDIVLLIAFTLMIGSGLIVALIYAPTVSRFHRLSVDVFGLLVVAHLVANRWWILGQIARFRKH